MLIEIVFIIIILIIIFYFSRIENFSNEENTKIYSIFEDVQKNNGTYADFKKELTDAGIRFSDNDSFNQYVELLEKYNKEELTVNTIDIVRSS